MLPVPDSRKEPPVPIETVNKAVGSKTDKQATAIDNSNTVIALLKLLGDHLLAGQLPKGQSLSITFPTDPDPVPIGTPDGPIDVTVGNFPSVQTVDGTVAATGVSTGNYSPDPITFSPDLGLGDVSPIQLDGGGNVRTRGQVLTDEGSFRDDFPGSAINSTLTGTLTFTTGSLSVTGAGTLFATQLVRGDFIRASASSVFYQVDNIYDDTTLDLTEAFAQPTVSSAAFASKWIHAASTGASISVGSSIVSMATGTTSGARAYVYREGDYSPFILTARVALTARNANQEFYFGMRDNIDTPGNFAQVKFSGTTATQVVCMTGSSTAAADQETTTVTLPNGQTTATEILYQVQVTDERVVFYANSEIIATHAVHIPGLYVTLLAFMEAKNTAAATTATLNANVVYFSNMNVVEVGKEFNGTPIGVTAEGEQHTILSELTTSVAPTETVILSYTVPANKTLYILGWSFETTNIGGRINIGRNTLGAPPAIPGALDGNIVRTVSLANGSASVLSADRQWFGFFPLKAASAGDVFKASLLANSSVSTTFRSSITFELK